MLTRKKNQLQSNTKQGGFTLIELLVVVAIIALLSSIALIALLQARAKSRNTKRLGEMTQMNTALEIFYTYNKGYPDDSDGDGAPDGIVPQFTARNPVDPSPADGNCSVLTYNYPDPADPSNTLTSQATRYLYIPEGSYFTVNSKKYYSGYRYYFCLGQKTGDYDEGVRYVTPTGVR